MLATPNARLRNWLNAAVAGSPTVWAGMDSLAEWKSFAGANGYAEKLRVTLQATFGNRGAGFFGCHRHQAIPNANEWTIGANWTNPGQTSVLDKAPWIDDVVTHAGSTGTTAADLITVVEPQTPFTSYKIWYVDTPAAAGTWAYRPDGGAWVNGPAQTGDGQLKSLTVNASFATSLDVRPSNAAGSVATKTTIIGISFYNGATGCLFNNFSHSGETMADLNRGGAGNAFAFMTALEAPDLVIIDSGNDAVNTGLGATRFSQHMLRFLTAFPASTAIILVTPPPFDPVANPTRPYVTQAAFRDEYYKIARGIGAEVIDIYNAWGENFTTAQGLGFTSIGDGLHPLDAGHQDIHDRVARVLGLL